MWQVEHPTVAAAAFGIGLEAVKVAHVGIDRLDRRDTRRMSCDQRQLTDQFVRGGVALVRLPRRRGSNRRWKSSAVNPKARGVQSTTTGHR